MKPEVRKELDALLTTVKNRIHTTLHGGRDYIGVDIHGNEICIPGRAPADCDGTEGFILDDLIEDLSKQMLPYVRRLYECKYITDIEYGQFLKELREKANELRERLRLPENPEGTQ